MSQDREQWRRKIWSPAFCSRQRTECHRRWSSSEWV